MNIQEINGIEEFIAGFPVFEYQLIDTESLSFESRVRTICEVECERYGTTWACPPAVGGLEECEKKCRSFSHGLFFSSVAEVSDILNMDELLATRDEHEKITGEIGAFLENQGYDIFILSTESCAICENCTYPDEPCRNPKRMHPCLESHGIVVSQIVEQNHMTYSLGGNTVLWFSMILF